MFQLSLVDHIRLSFGAVATSYRAHARAASRLSARAWQTRVAVMILLALATAASLIALTGLRYSQIAAAALAGVALLGFAIAISLDFETRRRDELLREVQVVYEHALPADRDAFQIAREALGAGEGAPSDQEIDRLLPASLRQPAGASST
jgi:hypothetical protein